MKFNVGDYVHWQAGANGRFYWAKILETRVDRASYPSESIYVRYVSSRDNKLPTGEHSGLGWLGTDFDGIQVMDDVEVVGMKLLGVL
jgi:hypothetical protein